MLHPLADEIVHLWRLDLGGAPSPVVQEILSADEIARAKRFAFDRDRNRYLRAHWATRDILGRYIGLAPQEVAIIADAFGKPLLAGSPALAFSLSHAGDIGVLAVTRAPSVGVDVETSESVRDDRLLAESVCTEGELLELGKEDGADLRRAFLTCWTRKEACLKAIGVGLAKPPQEIDVGATTAPRRIEFMHGGSRRSFEVTSVNVGDDCVVALAVEATRATWKAYCWSPQETA